MKNILFFGLLILFSSSCARQKVYKKYPDCTDYFNYVKQSWSKKDNGFFIVSEIPDSTKTVWAKLIEPPRFKQEWDKNMVNCLCDLTEKEVRTIFGKSTTVSNTFQHIKKVNIKHYVYYIVDEICDENSQRTGRDIICSFIAFSFWEGKQDRKCTSRPRIMLRNPYE